jgi:syntaxin-binding protein 1
MSLLERARQGTVLLEILLVGFIIYLYLIVIMEKVLHSPKDEGMKVLIVDKYTGRLLNASMTMLQVMAEDIVLIENIEVSRKKFKDFHGIYFVTPTPEAVLHMMNDFLSDPVHYKSANIIFCRPPPMDLIDKIKRSRLNDFIKTLNFIPIDCYIMEERVFHTDLKSAFHAIFTQSAKGGPNKELLHEQLKFMANRIAAAISLVESGRSPNASAAYPTPIIRYLKATSSRLDASEKLANIVWDTLKQNYKNNNLILQDKHSVATKEQQQQLSRSTLLILERSHDPVTPLLHEFTYQAMANDLLESHFQEIGGGGGKIFHFTADDGVQKEITLDEKDPIWMKTRHVHIAEVIEQVRILKFTIFYKIFVGYKGILRV